MATTDSPRFDSEFTVDDYFPAQYSRAYVRQSMLQGAYIRRILPIYVALVVIVFLSQLVLRGFLWGLVFGLPAGAVLAVLVFGVTLLANMRTTRRRVEASIPEGSSYSLALSERGFVLTDVVGSHRLSYEGSSPVRNARHIVVLRRTNPSTAMYVPAELFTPESLVFFNERVAASNPTGSN